MIGPFDIIVPAIAASIIWHVGGWRWLGGASLTYAAALYFAPELAPYLLIHIGTPAVAASILWRLEARAWLAIAAVAYGAALYFVPARAAYLIFEVGLTLIVLSIFLSGGGGSSGKSRAGNPPGKSEEWVYNPPETKRDPRIPEGAPNYFNPDIQPHGAHEFGYNPRQDPSAPKGMD